MPALASDPRFGDFASRSANLALLAPLMQEALLAKGTTEWLAICHAADVLASRIHDFGSWQDDPQVRATAIVAEDAVPGAAAVPWIRVPGALHPQGGDARLHWPEIGEHAGDILHDLLAMAPAEINSLRVAGVLPAAP